MIKFSKVLALALAATMVVSSSVVAFAGDNDGGSTGTGTSEGHVDKKKMNVVLPTIPSGSTPFAYIMDPERLIVETAGANHASVSFPASDADTGVYFNTGEKVGGDGDDKDFLVYSGTSAAQKVINKSSHPISLTATATATSADTDIPLVAKNAIADAEAASLYLGLIVGSENAVAIAKGTPATKTVTLAGVSGNFKTAVKTDGGYEYRVMTAAEWAAANNKEIGEGKDYADDAAALAAMEETWKDADIQLEGAVTEDLEITAATTAPTIAVTWSWEDPSATPAAPTVTPVAGYVSAANGVFYVAMSASEGIDLGDDTISAVTVNGQALTSAQYTVDTYDAGTWVGIPWASVEAVGEDEETEWAFEVTFGTTKVTATYK